MIKFLAILRSDIFPNETKWNERISTATRYMGHIMVERAANERLRQETI